MLFVGQFATRVDWFVRPFQKTRLWETSMPARLCAHVASSIPQRKSLQSAAGMRRTLGLSMVMAQICPSWRCCASTVPKHLIARSCGKPKVRADKCKHLQTIMTLHSFWITVACYVILIHMSTSTRRSIVKRKSLHLYEGMSVALSAKRWKTFTDEMTKHVGRCGVQYGAYCAEICKQHRLSSWL